MMPQPFSRKNPPPRAEFPAMILIVDDEAHARWSLSAGLRVAGFDTATAASAQDAKTLARRWPPPDVVILDARIYAEHADALLQDLRRAAPRCQFIVMAGRGEELLRARCDNVMIVRKPCNLSDVVRWVNSILAETCVA
jgi:DNA-binding NtrC family response regulator